MIKRLFIFIPLYCIYVVAVTYLMFGLCKTCQVPGLNELLAVLVYLGLIALGLWLLAKGLYAAPAWTAKVEQEGKPAEARILDVKNTGLVISNTVAVVRLRLRVEPPNEAPFEVTQEKRVSMINGFHGYSAGERVKVKYDPAHKDHLIVSGVEIPSGHRERSGDAVPDEGSENPDVTEKLEKLSWLHEKGELSDAEFAAAKKKLLG